MAGPLSGAVISAPGGFTDEALERHLRSKDLEPDLSVLPESALRPLRRLLWAKFLKVVSGGSLEEWADQLDVHRNQYKELKDLHRKEHEVKKFDPTVCNPLSKSSDNPLLKMQANKDLLEEIWKDIERTYSEMSIFQNDKCRKCMQQVLFHWCKACNPAADAAESYRQGMNELVALCMYVVLQGQYYGTAADGIGGRLTGEEHNESDTFALFSALMEVGGLRDMFEVVKAKPAAKKGPTFDLGEGTLTGRAAPHRPQQTRSAILARTDHIYNTLFKRLDVKLHAYLVDQGIEEAQIFMLRWLRLLFCREFHIDDTVVLWTSIFADAQMEHPENPLCRYVRKPGKGSEGVAVAEASSLSLPLVDFFAVAMIVHLKSQLLDLDESGCLQRLMKYPPVSDLSPLMELAKQLRTGNPAPAPVVQRETSPAPLPSPTPVSVPAASPPAATPAEERRAATPSDPLQTTAASNVDVRHVAAFVPSERVPDSNLASQLVELRRKVEKLEQEKIDMATKGRQFIAQKTAEFQAKVTDLQSRLANAGGAKHSDAEQQEAVDAAVQAAVAEASEAKAALAAQQQHSAELDASLRQAVAEQEALRQTMEANIAELAEKSKENEAMRQAFSEAQASSTQEIQSYQAQLAEKDDRIRQLEEVKARELEALQQQHASEIESVRQQAAADAASAAAAGAAAPMAEVAPQAEVEVAAALS